MTRLVILDRDGVINHDSDAFIKNAAEWHPIDGSIEAIAKLSGAGFTVAIASNQSGIGRGLLSENDLATIHDKLLATVSRAGGRIDLIVYCPHLPDSDCDCRKPKPGMLLKIADFYDVSLDGVPVIGDSLRDLQAATAAGARPVLVLTGNGRKTREQLQDAGTMVESFANLASAAGALTRSSS